MKILLIQLSDAADVLQSTLLLRCLKKSVPGAEVHLLVQQQHAEIIATNPYIDHLHRLHFNEQTTLHELKPQNFDHVLDLEPSQQSKHFVEKLQPPVPQQKQKGLKTFFSQLFKSTNSPQHKAERYLQKANAFQVVNDGAGLDFFIPKKEVVPFADIPAAHHAGFIAIALAATPAFKWNVTLLQQLCNAIPHPILLLGSDKERPLAQQVAGIDNIKIYNACGKFSLYENADLVRKAKLLILFQPYFIQLAAALNKELIMLATASKQDAPYYGVSFLKNRNTPPYDRINLSKHLMEKENRKTGDKKLDLEKTAAQISAQVVRRLKGES